MEPIIYCMNFYWLVLILNNLQHVQATPLSLLFCDSNANWMKWQWVNNGFNILQIIKITTVRKEPYLPKNPFFDQVSDKVKDLNLETPEGPQELSQQTQEQKRVSKAQKRRNKKEEATRQRQEEISKQEIENETGARNVEFQKLKEMLKKQGLQIFEIPSDGNCLYNAVAHQVNHRKTITDCKQLRKQAAEYMRGKEFSVHSNELVNCTK